MANRTITGTVVDEAGDAIASAVVSFTLMSPLAYRESDVVLRKIEEATTDESGAFSVSLAVPTLGAYLYRCRLPDGQVFNFTLADGSATTLSTIMASAVANSVSSANAVESLINTHNVTTTDVHGIADTSALVTTSDLGAYATTGSVSAVADDLSDHEADTDNPHGVTAAQVGADTAGSAAAAQAAAIASAAGSLASHNASPLAHGGIVASDDSRLTDARTPTAHAATHAEGGDDEVTPAAIGAEPAITGGTATQIWTGLKTWAAGVWLNVANTWTALQTYSAGIKTQTIAPLADATDAIKITNAAGTAIVTVDTTNKDVWLGTGVQYDETYKALFLNGTSAGYGITLPNNCAYSVTTSTGERVQVFRITGSNHIYVGPINWTASVSNTYINGNIAIHFRTRNAAATDYETSMTIHDQGGGVDFPFDIRVAGALSVGGNVDFSGLPTSDPGISGRLWNDGGTLKISAG